MNQTHLKKFKKMIPVGGMREKFQRDMERRDQIFSLAKKTENIATICDTILDWGGIHSENKNRLKSQDCKCWLNVAGDIKAGKLNRSTAYAKFSELQHDGKLKGIGPAYFTKLIYFLMPNNPGSPRGYIMDQWVGCSINILNEIDVVLMDSSEMLKWTKNGEIQPSSNYQVSNINTEKNYEAFCWQIELLAAEIGSPPNPDFTERLLMSKGGKTPLDWRAYVKENRKPRYE